MVKERTLLQVVKSEMDANEGLEFFHRETFLILLIHILLERYNIYPLELRIPT